MRMLRFRDLKARGIVGNRVTLARWIREQHFPGPLQLGANSIAWDERDVESWLASRRRPAPAAVSRPPADLPGDEPGGHKQRRSRQPAA